MITGLQLQFIYPGRQRGQQMRPVEQHVSLYYGYAQVLSMLENMVWLDSSVISWRRKKINLIIIRPSRSLTKQRQTRGSLDGSVSSSVRATCTLLWPIILEIKILLAFQNHNLRARKFILLVHEFDCQIWLSFGYILVSIGVWPCRPDWKTK
jgi:hypothetical protein